MEQSVRCRIADDSVPVGAKTLGIAESKPQDRRPPERHEALHHDREDVLPLDETAIEKSEPRRHQHDEARAEQHESGIADVYWSRCSIHRESLGGYPRFSANS